MDASNDVLAVELTDPLGSIDAIKAIEAADLGVGIEHLEPAEEPEGAISNDASADRSAISFEELREAVRARGRERGFVTSDELLEGLPVEDLAPEQIEGFLTQVEGYLRQEAIEIVDAEVEEEDPDQEVLNLRL